MGHRFKAKSSCEVRCFIGSSTQRHACWLTSAKYPSIISSATHNARQNAATMVLSTGISDLTHQGANSLVWVNRPFTNLTVSGSLTQTPVQASGNPAALASPATNMSGMVSFAQSLGCPSPLTVNSTARSAQASSGPPCTNTTTNTFITITTIGPKSTATGPGIPITSTDPSVQTSNTSATTELLPTNATTPSETSSSPSSLSISATTPQFSLSSSLGSYISTSDGYTPSFASFHTYTSRPSYIVRPSPGDNASMQKHIGTIVGSVCGVATFVFATFAVGVWWVHRKHAERAKRESRGKSGDGAAGA
ncbi:hypothetical protein B0J12DRAFT_103169 [Macrophomina phaseolina]|uniref:Uncharacterized protein n=1 Tax=Macrophomina phaseolina TaxID=35725 RepID=A0ABQ8GCX5_9PEZI|nr:hypothetical protein B0J12DRAFT_103169 [Macrophomina phaseolina]